MLIEARKICRSYRTGTSRVEAVRSCSFSLAAGEFLAITGPSGSGKSTLMSILGLLERPASGSLWFRGKDTGEMSAGIRARLRNQELGFVFQSYNLLPRLTALENVELPMIYAGMRAAKRKSRARALLRKTGLEDRRNHFPNQLSGGEQQRIAIARALANDPGLILADEPTGALDSGKGRQILALFQEINAEGRSIAVITHDEDVARRADRILRMKDGEIIGDEQVDPDSRMLPETSARFVRHQTGAGQLAAGEGSGKSRGGGDASV
ncbi:ABC transporter ATP-binding protein [Leisingera sp. ANG-M1]|uniref:ABC transporter ATP-binding protein n=1 Tax=Leisingera sp. ANG-M1 TaxID=1577895 RepID=UPI0009E1A0AC|nr:ABC transporter ATP-binding protein [Leisingera sp. ANG-M1]